MPEQSQHNLKSGSILQNYEIIRVLGEGGFGITYLAKDIQLDLEVVIKEYFPNEFAMRSGDHTITAKSKSVADFSKGKQRFKEEAQTLARFKHPSIVKILGYFEANDTAYFVMEYEEGIDLSHYLKQQNRALNQEEILSIMMPILEGLKEVHKYNYLHRDIKPGNILLRSNKSPVLIDFGASKLALGEASKSITSMLTEGYAPLEQYSTDIKKQGPFTDLYAVAAVIYKMITGKVPPSAQTRSYALLSDEEDPYKKFNSLELKGYDESFLKAVDRALSISAKERPQNVQEFQKDIAGELELEQVEPSQSNPEAEKNSNKDNTQKSNNGILMGLLVLILIAGGTLGYMLLQKKDLPQKVVTVENENVGKAQENKKPKVEKEKKEAEEIVKKVMEEVEKEKEMVKPSVIPAVEKPVISKIPVWSYEKIQAIVLNNLKTYGGAMQYGYQDIVKRYGDIPMKHTVFGVYPFFKSSKEYKLVATSTTTTKYNNTRGSGVARLSFFVFSVKDEKWALEYKHIAAGNYSHFGQAPKAEDSELIEVGKEQFALKLKNFMATQGYGSEYVTLYLIDQKECKKIFSEKISSNDGGTGNNAIDWKSTMMFDKNVTPLYNIILHKTGIEDKKPIDEKIEYKYNGQKYIKLVKRKVATVQTPPQCTYFRINGVKQLNIRSKPGKPSHVVGRVNNGDNVCIYNFKGKWGRTDRGWISRKYLEKDYFNRNNFLLADIDNDGKNEKLQWELFSSEDAYMSYYQLKLYDDNGKLLWKGPRNKNAKHLVAMIGEGINVPGIFADIDNDGNVEIIMGFGPHEMPTRPIGYNIYRWDGSTFVLLKEKYVLRWTDASRGNTLEWVKCKNEWCSYEPKEFIEKVWWGFNFEQTLTPELPVVTLVGIHYGYGEYENKILFKMKQAQISFTPTGAIIKNWIK